jgi:hypothetical protein
MTRKWFQIHLSTAVVLMFVAGGWVSLMTYMGKNPKSELWAWLYWFLETWIGGFAFVASACIAPIIILASTALLSEFFIRREARKP